MLYKSRCPKCLLLHHYKLGEPSSRLTLVKTPSVKVIFLKDQGPMFNKIINNKPVQLAEGCLGPTDAVDKEPDMLSRSGEKG